MDDRRLGLVIRSLRRRRNWRQQDLADRADSSQSVIARAEAGHFDTLSLRSIRRIAAALDIRLDLDARWHGGDLDRLIDFRHAAIVAAASTLTVDWNWTVAQEVTYAFYGDRGSIDLLGVNEATAAAVVMEIKSEVVSWEETQRRFDEKVRILPKVLFERFGWRPRIVAAVIVVDDTTTNRRRLDAVGPSLRQIFPAGTREVRRWLQQPTGNLRGIWFLSSIPVQGGKCKRPGFHRIRLPRDA